MSVYTIPSVVTQIPELPTEQEWPLQGEWTYEDYLRLPDDGKCYEIIEGVLYVANAPNYDHQYAVSKLLIYIGVFVTERDLGVVLTSPFEVHLSGDLRPVQPDLLYLSSQQQPAPGTQVYAGAPTLIIEVHSPSTITYDRREKFDAYERAGVAEYWLVNPKTRAVEVYLLSAGEYALLGEFTGDEMITSNVLPDLRLQTDKIFA